MKSNMARQTNHFQPNLDTWEMERHEFASLPRLPATLTDIQTGWRLNVTAEGIGILVRQGILKPLGGAGPDDSKRFASAYIEQLARNREWLDKATDVLYQSRHK